MLHFKVLQFFLLPSNSFIFLCKGSLGLLQFTKDRSFARKILVVTLITKIWSHLEKKTANNKTANKDKKTKLAKIIWNQLPK